MITCLNINERSVGRLGNKLFIIAAVIATAKKMGDVFALPFDWLTNYGKIFKNKIPVNNTIPDSSFHNYQEKGYHYTPIVTHPFPHINLNGYFQSEYYFQHCKDEVRKYFLPTDEIRNGIIRNYGHLLEDNVVSLHIRRGDYVQQPEYHPVMPVKYYEEALKYIDKRSKIDRVIVVSDDLNWCMENFKWDYKTHFSQGDEITDLFLQTYCKHNVIGNSSFSWWGAYLNSYTDKIVVAPSAKKNWFGNAYKDWKTGDLIPKEWIQIEF